jgi:ArsR family transcriptional regulator
MLTDDICEITYVNEDAVKQVQKKMLPSKTVHVLSNIFSILGDPTRVKLLFALTHRELCVCDLAALLQMSQSAVSHQLRLLRTANLVKYRKDGRVVYYSLADDHVTTLLGTGIEHANETD